MPLNGARPEKLDPRSIEVPEGVSLVVAWRRGTRLEGGEIRINTTVGNFLRRSCEEALQRLRSSRIRPYDPDMFLEEDEAILVEDAELVSSSPLKPIALPEEPLPLLSARSLPHRPLLLYGVTFRDSTGRRVAFVRKMNPHYGARPGGILAALGNTLTEVGGAVFSLDRVFDLIVWLDGIVAFKQSVFELLFKDSEAVSTAVPGWIQSIADHLPLAGDGAEVLERMANNSTRLRRRLRSINDRGHLAHVTIDQIRAHLRELQLDEADYIENDELVVRESDPIGLLDLLNEDLFVGGLTSIGFRSERKSARG